jgi:uncharacterized protein YqeY
MTMALKEKLEGDVKAAMLAKNEVVRDTLRMVLADLKRLEVQDGQTITPEIEKDVLLRAVKVRQQAIDEYTKANRPDLAAKEQAEMAVIQAYLPKALNEDETRAAVKDVIKETGISSKKDMGVVMKAVMARHKGQVDGKQVQKLLGELLS